MGMWNVEVEGRFTAVIEVEADGGTEAEEEAISTFEAAMSMYSIDSKGT